MRKTVEAGDGRRRADPVDLPQRSGDRAVAVALVLTMVAGYGIMLLPPSVFDVLIEEDSWVEMAGAFAFLAASGLAAASAIRLRQRPAGSRGSRLLPLVYAGLAVGFFLAAGEEISWLQRQLHVATPGGLSEVNLQDELNIHNIGGVEPLVEAITIVVWAGFALGLPLLSRVPGRVGGLVRAHLPVVPLWLGALFALDYVISKVAIAIAQGAGTWSSVFTPVHSAVEIEETLLAILFAASMWWLLDRVTGPRVEALP